MGGCFSGWQASKFERDQAKGFHTIDLLGSRKVRKLGGLPKEMQAKNIGYVADTASTVAPRALEITKTFYGDLLKANPNLYDYFNRSQNVPMSTHQPEALAASVVGFASNIKDLRPLLVKGGTIDAICHRHCALNIVPAHYPIVHEFLFEAIAKVMGAHNIKGTFIGDAWDESVLFLTKVCQDKEEMFYKRAESRTGGWRGLKEFKVVKVEEITKDVKSFSFQPAHHIPGLHDKFDFTVGQYLTIKVNPDQERTAPRHYTITSQPGDDHLRCTVKKLQQGKVSNYLHDKVKVGDTVQLSPPFGVFGLEDPTSKIVLISAGIGCTTMYAFSKAFTSKVALVVHVDKSPDTFAYRSHFESFPNIVKYTSQGGRPQAGDLAAEAVKKAGTNNVFFICGPAKFMEEMHGELMIKGAKKVKTEVFGSQLSTKCPFVSSGPIGTMYSTRA